METNNTEFIKQAVMRGDSISFLVRVAVLTELKEGKLVTIPIEDCRILASVSIAYLRNQHLSRPAQAFLEFLQVLSPADTHLQSLGSLVAGIAVSQR
jgi:DNA-binding transcriptional LysR family regulator